MGKHFALLWKCSSLDLDRCQAKAASELPEDNRYFIGDVGENDWKTARGKCVQRGSGWDLAIIDDAKGKLFCQPFWNVAKMIIKKSQNNLAKFTLKFKLNIQKSQFLDNLTYLAYAG